MKYEIDLISSSAEFYNIAIREMLPGEELFKNMNSLLHQLSPHSPEMTLASVEAFYRAGGVMAVVRHRKTIVGIAHLAPVIKVNGVSARIEDVVVDTEHRGQNLGRLMMEGLIETARACKISHLALTSAPEREAANHLYRSLGFVKIETNVYRLVL